jgi:ABC-type phosphate/phosphonate transport system substrate-binding protein
MQPFQSLIEQHTGLEGELALGGNPDRLGKQLVDGKFHLGVFHGFELAWARQRHPSLKPLVLALTKHPELHAYLVVRKECDARSLADLKGQAVAMPGCNRPHSLLFLERACQTEGKAPAQYFSRITKPSASERALDQVVDGEVRAALVDQAALDCYQEWKAARFAKLKIAVRSEPFPATAIAYCSDNLSEATAQRYRDGFLKANDTSQGQQVLVLCGIKTLKAVPSDYEEALAAIAKAYPPPSDSSH